MFIGEMGSINVDKEMHSTLDGLWSVGDACKTGSGITGATPPPCRLRGSGLTWAGVSSILAENSVAAYAADASEPVVHEDQVVKFREEILSPMQRKKGMNPREAIRMLQEVITPPRYSIRKSEDRLNEAMHRVNEVYNMVAEEVSPGEDWHMLGLFHDLRNMTYCSELYLTASLERKETRGWHVREDYPEQDDKNWRKWIIQKMEKGMMKISTRDIPYGNYKYNP